ncbi:MAG: RNA-directed DNA polymerase [Lepagella sp.]
MKRFKDSDVIPLIVAPANLAESISAILSGTLRKLTRQGKEILEHQSQIEDWLAAEISSGSFYLTSYGEKELFQCGKKRRIQFLYSYYEKIGVHAIMNVVEQMTYNRLIRTTAASIKGRGVHDLLNKIRNDIRSNPEVMIYVYEDDITKFYESIVQDCMMDVLRRFFKGPIILGLLEKFVKFLPSGLSIGMRSSQQFGNLLLSVALDHYLMSEHQVKNYYRYCDDKRIIAPNKKDLWRDHNMIDQRLREIGLKIKPNYRVFPISEGIDFLGYRIYKYHTLIRKRNKKNAARRLRKIKSKRRRREIIASFYSLCKHANAKNLFHKITGIKMSDYQNLKSLADIGISSTPGIRRNGQKNFAVRELSLSQLTGTTLCILDFQSNISTKWSRRAWQEAINNGDPNAVERTKFLVCARVVLPNRAHLAAANISLKRGEVIKFFTGYPDMCDICDMLREKNMLGENKVTVTRNAYGRFTEYLFT